MRDYVINENSPPVRMRGFNIRRLVTDVTTEDPNRKIMRTCV